MSWYVTHFSLRVHCWNYILEDEGSFRTLGIPIVPQPVEFPCHQQLLRYPNVRTHRGHQNMDPWNSWNNVPQLRQSFSSARLIRITLRVSNHCEPRYSHPLSTKSIWMFLKIGVGPKWIHLQWNTLLKWVILGYPYFWKHPYYEDIYTRILFETHKGRSWVWKKIGGSYVPPANINMPGTVMQPQANCSDGSVGMCFSWNVKNTWLRLIECALLFLNIYIHRAS